MIRQICKTQRKKLGLTQAELADRIGVRKATISQFESGRKKTPIDIVDKIIKELSLQIKPAD